MTPLGEGLTRTLKRIPDILGPDWNKTVPGLDIFTALVEDVYDDDPEKADEMLYRWIAEVQGPEVFA